MERAVQIQLVAFLTENNILSMHQSGFRKKHSTQTTITYLADCILDNMDNQKMTGIISKYVRFYEIFVNVYHQYHHFTFLVEKSSLQQPLFHFNVITRRAKER